MKIKINNQKLKVILQNRQLVVDEIKKIIDEMNVLDQKRLQLGYKMDNLKEKTKIIVDKQDIKLNEFEFVAKVELENGEPTLEILDQIEEYKNAIREDRIKKFDK